MDIFLHNKRGEYDGSQSGVTPADIKIYKAMKMDFVVITGDENGDEYYVPNPTAPHDERILVIRPNLNLKINLKAAKANGVDEVKITGLPDPCVLIADGKEIEVTGGSAELSFNIKGVYLLEVKHWPYKDWSASVRAT